MTGQYSLCYFKGEILTVKTVCDSQIAKESS